MADIRRDLGGLNGLRGPVFGWLLLSFILFPGPLGRSVGSAPVESAGTEERDGRTLLLWFASEDLAVVRHFNAGDIAGADKISNSLQGRLARALADSSLAPYHDDYRSLLRRVSGFDDEQLDPRTGDSGDRLLWPEYRPVDWVPGFLESWRRSWESGEIELYLDHYSSQFLSDDRSGNLDLEAWGERKKLLARGRPDLHIGLDRIRVYPVGDSLIVHFRQDYRSNQFRATGNKSLILLRDRGSWRILREEMGRRPPLIPPVVLAAAPTIESVEPTAPIEPAEVIKPPETVTPPRPEPPPPARFEEEVRVFLADWEVAWESMDLPAYLAHYSEDRFRFKGGGKSAWGEKKGRIWAGNGSAKVELEELSIVINNERAVVRFVQIYRSRSFGDRGHKTLELLREDDGWRIVKEVWVP
jgi:ketosteroid isomerase-like protein